VIDPKKVTLKGRIDFTYDAPVFDGDPDDVFEIARLEQNEFTDAIREAVEEVIGTHTTSFRSLIDPE